MLKRVESAIAGVHFLAYWLVSLLNLMYLMVLSFDPVAMSSPSRDQQVQYMDPRWCFVRLQSTDGGYTVVCWPCLHIIWGKPIKLSARPSYFNYLSLDSWGYWQMRKVLELEPTAYNFPFGWKSTLRIAWESDNVVTASKCGLSTSPCGRENGQ